MKAGTLLAVALCLSLATLTAAAQEWQMTHGLSAGALADELEAGKDRHFVPVEIESTVQDGHLLYSTVLVEDPDTTWALRRGMSATGLRDWTDQYDEEGLAPVSLAIDAVGDGASYAAIWHENDGGEWQLRLDDPGSSLQAESDVLGGQGYVPIAISGYTLSGESRFATIWRRAAEPTGWQLRTNLSLEDLQAAYDELTPNGFAPTDLSSYEVDGETRFAATWVQNPGVRWEARAGMTGADHAAFAQGRETSGFVPHAIAAYRAGGQLRYAGAWHRPAQDPDGSATSERAGQGANGAAGEAVGPVQRTVLPIAPVVQQTPVWCWVAVGEMLFRHYGLPNVNPGGNYQCGIIGRLSPPMSPCDRDCGLCVVPSGSNLGTLRMISEYTRRTVGRDARYVESNRVPAGVFVSEIDAHRPVLVGVSTNRRTFGEAEHVALVVGYARQGNAVDLIVNDPYPYPRQANPYVAHGGTVLAANQYRIPYASFRDGVFWHWTVHDLRL